MCSLYMNGYTSDSVARISRSIYYYDNAATERAGHE